MMRRTYMQPLMLLLVIILMTACDASRYDADMSFRAIVSTCANNTLTVRRVDDENMRTLTITCKSTGKQ